MKRGPFAITQIRFRDFRLVEQTEQKLQGCLEEKTSYCNNRALVF